MMGLRQQCGLMGLCGSVSCAPPLEPVDVTGRLLDEASEDGGAVPNGEVWTRDSNGSCFDETVTDDDGQFSVQAPANDYFFIMFHGDGFASTSFTGFSGTDTIDVDDGTLWAMSAQNRSGLFDEFANCAALEDIEDQSGGILEGEVRLYFQINDPDDLPFLTTATVTAFDSDDVELETCYLDDEGISDADAFETGETGRFAVFGMKQGGYTVQVTYDAGTGSEPVSTYIIWMPENGVVPLEPAYVELD